MIDRRTATERRVAEVKAEGDDFPRRLATFPRKPWDGLDHEVRISLEQRNRSELWVSFKVWKGSESEPWRPAGVSMSFSMAEVEAIHAAMARVLKQK